MANRMEQYFHEDKESEARRASEILEKLTVSFMDDVARELGDTFKGKIRYCLTLIGNSPRDGNARMLHASNGHPEEDAALLRRMTEVLDDIS